MREAAVDTEDVEKVRGELAAAEKVTATARQLADAAARQNSHDPSVFERAGAAAATAQAKREQLGRYEAKKNNREAIARDLRRQIEELRSQLSRYAEALEEDLAQGREKVAVRTREGLGFEKSFSEGSNMLLGHLRTKPECRDLVTELLNAHQNPNGQDGPETKQPMDKRVERN
jgi:serine/threonine-protein kinase